MKVYDVIKNSGMSIKEISRQTGIGYHTLQKCSRRKTITVKNAKKLGKLLKFDWWLLFEEEDS